MAKKVSDFAVGDEVKVRVHEQFHDAVIVSQASEGGFPRVRYEEPAPRGYNTEDSYLVASVEVIQPRQS